MMAMVTRVLRSEWTKIRSVRSTLWTLGMAVTVTVSIGTLISALVRHDYATLSAHDKRAFDPTFTSFAGTGLGQLAMIVFGVLVVSGEYGTGMIRTSLAAVPRRGVLLFCKIAVATLAALVVGLVTSCAAFATGQLMLGRYGASPGDPGVLRAVIGGGLYMTLITVFSMAVATMLRSPMLSLGVLMPFFFLISNILANVSVTRTFGAYLPDQAGQKIMRVVTPEDPPPYGPWGGFAIMALWVAVAVTAGYLLMKRRDA